MPKLPFDINAWFWVVGDDRFYSSAAGAYVPADDIAAWCDAGGVPSRIGSEAELADVLNAPVLADIARVEAGTLRALRDAAAGEPGAAKRLADAEDQIAALRATLVKAPFA